MMKKIFIFLTLILVTTFLISQVSAFGCAPLRNPNKYASLWKEATGKFNLKLCFPINNDVKTLLNNVGITYLNGELQGNFNLKEVGETGVYKVYIDEKLLDDPDKPSTIVNYLRRQQDFFEPETTTGAERVAGMLKTLSLFMLEDNITQINYLSEYLNLDWHGITSLGEIEVPRYLNGEDNIMYAGEIISTFYFKNKYNFYTQPEIRFSGLKLEFSNTHKKGVVTEERKLTWLTQDGFFSRYDKEGNLKDKFTATKGTILRYEPKTKSLEKIEGKLYRNNEEIIEAIVKFIPVSEDETETMVCCLTKPNYCVKAEEKLLPIVHLASDCSFAIGNFNIEHDKEKGETLINEQNVEISYTQNEKRILELIRIT